MRDGILLAEDPPTSLIQTHHLLVSATFLDVAIHTVVSCLEASFADTGGCVFEALQETRGRKGGGIWRVIEYRKLLKM